MKKQLYTLILVAIASVLAMACGKPADNTADPGNTNAGASVAFPNAEIEEMYKKNNCLSCHGAGLGGRVGAETNLETVGSRLTKEQIAQQIAKGSKNMPAYEKILKPEEIDTIAEWLASLK